MSKGSNARTILFVDNRTEYFASHRFPLAIAARDNGYDVHVTTLTAGDTEKIQRKGFPYYPIAAARRTGRVFDELRLFYRLWRLYRELRPDLIHHVTLRCVLYGGLILAIHPRPRAAVYSITGLGYIFTSRGRTARLARWLIGGVLRLVLARGRVAAIFQNSDDQRLFVGSGWIRESQATLLRGSGVDLEFYEPSEVPHGTRPIVLFVGRLLKHKGIEEFVAAAEELKSDFPHVVFAAAGDPDADNPSSVDPHTLEKWQRAGAVEFLGHCEDMREVLRRASVVCLPSYREGMPKALIEAAAIGRPLVATDVPGCREIVNHGLNGMLVESQNSGALREGLRTLLLMPEKWTEMGRASRRIVESEYSVPYITRRILDVYDRLLDESVARP